MWNGLRWFKWLDCIEFLEEDLSDGKYFFKILVFKNFKLFKVRIKENMCVRLE